MKHFYFDLKEALERDPEVGPEGYKRLVALSERHPIISRALKEGLFQDAAAALGGMQTTVWDVAYPKQISREVLNVITTTRTAERFYKGRVGYVFDQSGDVLQVGPKVDYVDITVNRTKTAGQHWNQDFAEDVAWNVMAYESKAIGKDIAKQENADAVALLEGITAGNLAGGAEVTVTDGAMTWAELVAGIEELAKIDRYPDVIVGNPDEILNLLTEDKMISSLYNPPQGEGWRQGVVYHTQLALRIITCSQFSKVHWIDTAQAGVMLLRSDLMTQPWEDRANFRYGISARERYGMGILFSDAVARGTY